MVEYGAGEDIIIIGSRHHHRLRHHHHRRASSPVDGSLVRLQLRLGVTGGGGGGGGGYRGVGGRRRGGEMDGLRLGGLLGRGRHLVTKKNQEKGGKKREKKAIWGRCAFFPLSFGSFCLEFLKFGGRQRRGTVGSGMGLGGEKIFTFHPKTALPPLPPPLFSSGKIQAKRKFKIVV